jgi:predicted transcriptional regulator
MQALTVAGAMVTRPAVQRPSTTVGELRAFFDDDHLHMALLVEEGRLIGTVERSDLAEARDNEAAASAVARLRGRTVSPDEDLFGTFVAMKRAGRRRLAVVSDDTTLLGLLCLKASGRGFCSDADVASRQSSQVTLT